MMRTLPSIAVALVLALLSGCAGHGAPPDEGDGPGDNPPYQIGVIRGMLSVHGPRPLYRTPDEFWYMLALRDTATDELARTELIDGDVWQLKQDFDFDQLPLASYRLELLRHPVSDPDTFSVLYASDPLTVTLAAPLADEVKLDYYLTGEGEGILSYQYRLFGDPANNPDLAEKYIYTCFRLVGDENDWLFLHSQDWKGVIQWVLPAGPYDGLIVDDMNNDKETDAIYKLPDVPVIIGVYGFDQPDATGDEYVVYGELESTAHPAFNEEKPAPVVIDVDFDHPVQREASANSIGSTAITEGSPLAQPLLSPVFKIAGRQASAQKMYGD